MVKDLSAEYAPIKPSPDAMIDRGPSQAFDPPKSYTLPGSDPGPGRTALDAVPPVPSEPTPLAVGYTEAHVNAEPPRPAGVWSLTESGAASKASPDSPGTPAQRHPATNWPLTGSLPLGRADGGL